jgi:hypothetical protein
MSQPSGLESTPCESKDPLRVEQHHIAPNTPRLKHLPTHDDHSSIRRDGTVKGVENHLKPEIGFNTSGLTGPSASRTRRSAGGMSQGQGIARRWRC